MKGVVLGVVLSGSGVVKGKGRFELKLGNGLGKGKKKIATQNSNHDDGMVEDLADSEVLQFFHQDMMVAMATDTHNNQDGEAARMQEDIRDGNPINTNADQVNQKIKVCDDNGLEGV
ncbi:hypothetical protein ACOSQ2_011839 [Xanthoceras sorbifolium]